MISRLHTLLHPMATLWCAVAACNSYPTHILILLPSIFTFLLRTSDFFVFHRPSPFFLRLQLTPQPPSAVTPSTIPFHNLQLEQLAQPQPMFVWPQSFPQLVCPSHQLKHSTSGLFLNPFLSRPRISNHVDSSCCFLFFFLVCLPVPQQRVRSWCCFSLASVIAPFSNTMRYLIMGSSGVVSAHGVIMRAPTTPHSFDLFLRLGSKSLGQR